MVKVRTGGCTHCGGDLAHEDGIYGGSSTLKCIQCGRVSTVAQQVKAQQPTEVGSESIQSQSAGEEKTSGQGRRTRRGRAKMVEMVCSICGGARWYRDYDTVVKNRNVPYRCRACRGKANLRLHTSGLSAAESAPVTVAKFSDEYWRGYRQAVLDMSPKIVRAGGK